MKTLDYRRFLKDEFDRQESYANAMLSGLDSEQLDWKPDEESWSVREIVEHLRLTNEAYLSEVSMAVRRSDMTEPEGQEYVTPKLAQRFINAVGPNGNDKTPVPKVLVPHSEHTPENTLELFLKHYTAVQEFMIEATMTDLVRTKLKSPIMPILKFQLGDAFKIILMHNERHLKQIERLMSLTVFPKKKLTEARKASLH